MSPSATDKAKLIRLLIVDVDGVLTDGGLIFDNDGREYKRFNSRDGHGIRMLLESGIEIGAITGRQSNIVEHRMRDLGVKHVYQGHRDKLPALQQLLQTTGIEARQTAYIGDDLPDLPVMGRIGLSIAVRDAHSFVKQHCDWVTSAPGGQGAVREVTDFILQAQALLDLQQDSYLK